MKERPIPFSGPMVKAILDGRKTMTRRVIKPLRYGRPAYACPPFYSALKWWVGPHPNGGYFAFDNPMGTPKAILKDQRARKDRTGFGCPHGIPGDLLWVRETWTCAKTDGLIPVPIYRADGEASHTDGSPVKWTSPIFMPRWASRITLEITDIRVERLKEITPEDCLKEGIEAVEGDGLARLDKFESLWNSIHGKDSWDINPYVWVISFKRQLPLS